MPLEHDQIHLFGYFTPDGAGAMWGYHHWGEDCWLPVPGPVTTHEYPQLIIVPLDEYAHIWRRLRAEAWALDPNGVAAGAQGHPMRLRHRNGRPHPQHAHIHLPGDFAWDGAMHPAVQHIHDRMLTMTRLEMIHL